MSAFVKSAPSKVVDVKSIFFKSQFISFVYDKLVFFNDELEKLEFEKSQPVKSQSYKKVFSKIELQK